MLCKKRDLSAIGEDDDCSTRNAAVGQADKELVVFGRKELLEGHAWNLRQSFFIVEDFEQEIWMLLVCASILRQNDANMTVPE